MTTKIQSFRPQPLLSQPPAEDWMRVTRSNDEMIREALRQSREKKDAISVASLLFHMRGIGLDVEINEDDKKIMLERLEQDRRSGWAEGVGKMHYYMRGLGMK